MQSVSNFNRQSRHRCSSCTPCPRKRVPFVFLDEGILALVVCVPVVRISLGKTLLQTAILGRCQGMGTHVIPESDMAEDIGCA